MLQALISAPAAALLRWIAFGAAAVVMGVAVYHTITPPAPAPHGQLVRLVRWGALLVLLTAMGRMAQQALSFAGDMGESWAMVGILLGTPWGQAWLAQVLAASILTAAPTLIARRPESTARALGAGVVVAALVAAPAFQGHAIGSSLWPALAVAGDVLHLAAAGMWIGTLVVIVSVALPRSDGISADTLIRAFSPYALGGAATLAATGLFASWLHVRNPFLVWDSTYGRVLLLKIALVAGVAAVGAVNWRRLTPQLTSPGGVARLARAARGELALAAAVFLVTAVLVATPLPGE